MENLENVVVSTQVSSGEKAMKRLGVSVNVELEVSDDFITEEALWVSVSKERNSVVFMNMDENGESHPLSALVRVSWKTIK